MPSFELRTSPRSRLKRGPAEAGRHVRQLRIHQFTNLPIHQVTNSPSSNLPTASLTLTMPTATARKPTKARTANVKGRAAKPASRLTNPKSRKFVYFFGGGKADGNRHMKDLLGGKGSGLAEMTNAGLPVPAGFTISTEVCNIYYKEKARIPAAIDREIAEHVRKLEKVAGATLGSTEQPLLVSVRSGAKFSMPGMMDTILNLGLNDKAVEGLKRWTGNGRFAFDSYRRFIQMFGSVVLEIGKDVFEHEFEGVKKAS